MTKKIAIPVDASGILDGHFGHCKLFAVITTVGGEVISEDKLVPPPHEPGVLPVWLADRGVTDVIAGGLGQKAIELFNKKNVNVFVGAPQLTAGELIEGYFNNSLTLTANYCNHDHNHDENHVCSKH